MGSINTDAEASDDDKPQHTVFLDSFWIDRTEVTNSQYVKCVTEGVCVEPGSESSYTRSSYYNNPEFADYPVVYISWVDATTYCTWADKRLPTEAEWEKAARGPNDARIYPWGYGIPDCDLANVVDKSVMKHCVGDTSAVGSYRWGVSPYGVMDLAGNVWEWVYDFYQLDYYSTSPARNPQGPASGTERVLRGGCWGPDWYSVRVSTRDRRPSEFSTPLYGFRCAMSPES